MEPGAPGALHQVGEAGKGRLRRRLVDIVLGPQQSDQPADLSGRVPARRPDERQRRPDIISLRRHALLGSAGRERDCSQGVADDVVQVAGDPPSLLLDHGPRPRRLDPALPGLQKQLAAVRAQRGVLFQGETSRGLLLTSFGFSDLGVKAGQAATVTFAAAAVLALLSLGALVWGFRGAKEAAQEESALRLRREVVA